MKKWVLKGTNRLKQMKKKIVLLSSLVIVVGGLLLPIQSGFFLEDLNEEFIYFFPTTEKKLTVGWYHSVELTPWEETFKVTKDGKLAFESTVYKTYGAGTPDVEGNVEILDDGFVRVTGISRIISFYALFYMPNSHYYLRINNDMYELKDYVSDYTNVHISYRKLPLYKWLVINYLMN